MAETPEPTSIAEIAVRLELTREALGKSAAELCRITGISEQRWNNAVTGDNRLSLDDAYKLCRATGVSLDWIYRGIRVYLPAMVLEALARLENAPKDTRRRA